MAKFKINGFTVFEALIPPEKIDRIHDDFLPKLIRLRDREQSGFHSKNGVMSVLGKAAGSS